MVDWVEVAQVSQLQLFFFTLFFPTPFTFPLLSFNDTNSTEEPSPSIPQTEIDAHNSFTALSIQVKIAVCFALLCLNGQQEIRSETFIRKVGNFLT